MTPEFTHEFVPGTSRRTLVLLHGTGGDEKDLLPLGKQLDPAAALLSPRGKVLEHGQPRFFRRLAPGVFDEQDLRLRTQELAAFLQAAREEYGLQESELIAAGYSNGANIAASLLLLHPGVLQGAILLRAMPPLTLDLDQVPDLHGTRLLIAGGRQDTMVPPEGSEKLVGLLRHGGAEVELYWASSGHDLTRGDLTAAQAWLGAAV